MRRSEGGGERKEGNKGGGEREEGEEFTQKL